MEVKKRSDYVQLLASGARYIDGEGDSVRLPGMVNAMAFVLDVTAAAQDAPDALDVYVQTKLDGTNWVDVVRFTQCSGTGGAKRYFSKLCADTAVTEFENATGLGEHSVRHLLGDEWRVRWVVTDLVGTPTPTPAVTPTPAPTATPTPAVTPTADSSFTFSVVACPM